MNRITSLAAAALLAAALPASASTITFDLGGVRGTETDSRTQTVTDANGNDVTIVANGVVSENLNIGVTLEEFFSAGIGVTGGSGNRQIGSGEHAPEKQEGIVFQIPDGFRLVSATLSGFATSISDERAQLFTTTSVVGGLVTLGDIFTSAGGNTTINVAGTLTGLVGISAIERLDTWQSRFGISSITIAAVPLPAAAWFMLTALAGLFGMKRMRATA